MNAVLLLQRIGKQRISDIDGADYIVQQVSAVLPDDIHFDSTMTGEEIVGTYMELGVDVKKSISGLNIDDKDIVINILNDLYGIETRQRDMAKKERSTRTVQLIVAMLVLDLFILWMGYGYAVYAKKELGSQYHSSLVEYVLNIYQTIHDPDSMVPPPEPPPQETDVD